MLHAISGGTETIQCCMGGIYCMVFGSMQSRGDGAPQRPPGDNTRRGAQPAPTPPAARAPGPTQAPGLWTPSITRGNPLTPQQQAEANYFVNAPKSQPMTRMVETGDLRTRLPGANAEQRLNTARAMLVAASQGHPGTVVPDTYQPQDSRVDPGVGSSSAADTPAPPVETPTTVPPSMGWNDERWSP